MAILGDSILEGTVSIFTGPFGSSLHSYDYVDDGIPVVPTEAIVGGRLDSSTFPKIKREKANELSRYELRQGDLVFARRGAQACGLSAIVDADCEGAIAGTGTIVARINDPKRIHSRYFSYMVGAPESVEWLKRHAVGATMPNLNSGIIAMLPVSFPPLEAQRAIAAVLGALDDKIELNRRMNATLEAMARALFQSWFVDFDPVRAKVEGRPPAGLNEPTAALFPAQFQDSELGPVPQGWEVKPLTEAIEVNPRRSLAKGAIAPYLDMKNLPTAGHSADEVIDREFSSGTKFQSGDTLLARITPCLENGKTGFVDFLGDGQIGWGSTEFIVFAPRPPLPPQFGYLLARSEALRAHAIQNMTGTSGRQRVSTECFNKFLLAVPPCEIAERFDELTAPLMAKIKANADQSRTLATQRDTLLPKLLSGESRVADADVTA